MVFAGDIYHFLDNAAPFDTALDYDNAGLLVGGMDMPVTGIAVALDITPQAVLLAQQKGCNLLVSHHPVIFNPIKRVKQGTAVYELARFGMSAICAHTNLDCASGGVNDVLVSLLELQAAQPLADPEFPHKPPIARLCRLPAPMEGPAFAQRVKGALQAGCVHFTPASGPVLRVAVCSGAGGDLIAPAKNAGADAIVTGELRHHELILARELDIMAVDAGHFATERPVVPVLAARLAAAFPDLMVTALEEDAPFQVI